MPNAFLPEKPLLIYPSLAATLGLEESVLLCALSDRVTHMEAQQSNGFAWHQLAVSDLETLLPFWDRRALQRISTNLREKGVLIVNAASLEHADTFRFAFNQKVQNQLRREPPQARQPSAPSTPTRQPEYAAQPAPASSNPFKRNSGQYDGHFLSKNSIAPNWQPDDITLDQLGQHNITRQFALQCVPEFVTYWRERGERHHSWGAKFIQHSLRLWRDYEAKQHRKSQESHINAQWQPSHDALDILIGQAGIRKEFIEDAIPEFVLYWSERGEAHRTWNTKFVQHVRIQWAKYTSAIEHNTEPRPIPADWQPSEDVYDVLRLANIDLRFAHSLTPEFVLYWRDRGLLFGSWNTKYLQHVKRTWAQRHDQNAETAANNRSTREISLEEQLTDRSWADS